MFCLKNLVACSSGLVIVDFLRIGVNCIKNNLYILKQLYLVIPTIYHY